MDWETVQSYSWQIMMPEFTILGIITLVTLLDLFMRDKIPRKLLAYISLGGIGIALFFLFQNMVRLEGTGVQEILYETYRLDGFSNGFKLLFLVGTAMVFLLSLDYVSRREVPYEGEFYYLILTALLGAMIVASSSDMITLFVGLELLSISSYILVGVRKKNKLSNESAFKYVVSGGIASAIMLFGMSYIYGLTGTTNLYEVRENLQFALDQGHDILIYFAFFVTFIGMSFKISAAPFHMWTPDVYQGAPTPITAFLSVVSKAAGFALILRFFLIGLFPVFTTTGDQMISIMGNVGFFVAIIAAATMIIGTLVALRQIDVKRLFAYSSIAQAGYVLVPFAVIGPYVQFLEYNVQIMIYYLGAYLLMNLGAFAIIQLVTKDRGTNDVSAFSGLYQRSPFQALAMTLFILSLAGLPPAAGFIGKVYIFMSSVQSGFIWLASIMVVTSIISYYYYFGVLRQIWVRQVDEEDGQQLKTPVGSGIVLVLCLVGTLAMFVLAGVTLEAIDHYFNVVDMIIR